MSIEAMKQALEALENTARSAVEQYVAEQKAITALRQAIEQAEKQEPDAWRNAAIRLGEELSSVGSDRYYDMTAKQWLDWALHQQPKGKNSLPSQVDKQKPVAYLDEKMRWAYSVDEIDDGEYDGFIPLYTAPPRKEWVELNLDDIPDVFIDDISFCQGAKWAQAKLKEKNGGS